MSLRLGIDIDGVLADMAGAPAPSRGAREIPDFWESLDEIEPGSVERLAKVAAARRWEVMFLTRRPDTGGATSQIQTQRWLERHGFPMPSVYVVTGSRGKIASALDLDVVIDDTLQNCLDVALESGAQSILVWPGDDALAQRSLRGLKVRVVASLNEYLDSLDPSGSAERRARTPVARSTAVAHDATVAQGFPPSPGLRRASSPVAPGTPVLPPTRRTYLTAAVLFGLFAIYGSLVPLNFRPLPLDEALARFSRISYLALGVGSRADFVSNILLFIPLGFLLSGACLVDRRGWARSVLAAIGIGLFGLALSVAIEFTQVYFPPRTVSLNDIVAETSGALLGVVLWRLAGQALTDWVRAFSRERRRPLLLVRLLAAYTALFLISQLMPFDITIDLGELAQKYREGRIVLMPLGHPYPSMLAAAWDIASDVLLWIPVGALASIGWLPPNTRRRRVVHAFTVSLLLVCLVELAQVFIFTRYADVTDILTGALGLACGIFAVTVLSPSGRTPAPASGIRVQPIAALLVWISLLAVYHWAPFDFVISRDVLRDGLSKLWVVPFRNYYFGSEFHAFTELTRKFLLAAPVGALLRLALPPPATRASARLQHASILVIALIVFGALEAGQMFLPARTADLTDVLIAMAGVEAGCWLVERLRESRSRVEYSGAVLEP